MPAKTKSYTNLSDQLLIMILKEEKKRKYSGGIYHKTQIDLAYNSNHIEGSRLSHEQTRYMFETNTIGIESESVNIDDIIETVNHFRAFDHMLDHIDEALSESLIKTLHSILKSGTSDSQVEWFVVEDYKKIPNEVGGRTTALPEEVPARMKKLIKQYNAKKEKTLKDLLNFHVCFEQIHPFQDGNGRVGRLILYRECLRNNIVPFIIEDNLKMYYYRGLKEWEYQQGYLMDTCLHEQDNYKEVGKNDK